MATTRYTQMEFEAGQKHDQKHEEVELYLLDKIQTANSASVARNWAESYALVRGSVTSTSHSEVKS